MDEQTKGGHDEIIAHHSSSARHVHRSQFRTRKVFGLLLTPRQQAHSAVPPGCIPVERITIVSIAEDDWPQLSADKWSIVARTSFWNKRDVALEVPIRQLLAVPAAKKQSGKNSGSANRRQSGGAKNGKQKAAKDIQTATCAKNFRKHFL